MYYIGKYKGDDLMSDLVCNNPTMLSVLSIFGISLGFANSTIDELCVKNDIDTDTFLAIVNTQINEEELADDVNISLETMIRYLKNSHSYYLDFRLPTIRRRLIDAIGSNDRDMGILIIRYFDDYALEVRKHMEYEEERVFPYILSLVNNTPYENYNINIFSENHTNIDSRLSELKDIIIKYCPINSSNELINALYDIFVCAKDSQLHNMIEDFLLIPYIKRVEGR